MFIIIHVFSLCVTRSIVSIFLSHLYVIPQNCRLRLNAQIGLATQLCLRMDPMIKHIEKQFIKYKAFLKYYTILFVIAFSYRPKVDLHLM